MHSGLDSASASSLRPSIAKCPTGISGLDDITHGGLPRQKPSLPKGEEIVALPTLIKQLPAPLRRFIGDMDDEEKLLFGMDVVTLPVS